MSRRQFESSTTGKQLLTTKEAAEYLGVSISYLEKSRMRGPSLVRAHAGKMIPPPAHTVLGPRTVRYAQSVLDAWLAVRSDGKVCKGCQ
jgi:predicted DNA-binding transcriptional regulator AlpA